MNMRRKVRTDYSLYLDNKLLLRSVWDALAGQEVRCIFQSTGRVDATFLEGRGGWSTTEQGLNRVRMANRMIGSGRTLGFKQYLGDFVASRISNDWSELRGASNRIFVVQTNETVIQRCILMTTDPGDLVLDPTCGSGTTAYVAEQWGRGGSPSTPLASP